MSEVLAPLSMRFDLLTSKSSLSHLVRENDWGKYSFPDFRRLTRNLHLQYLLQALAIRTRGARDVVFQSFDELAVILFKIIHPRARIHLIITSNLTPERFQRSPIKVRAFLGIAFKLATSIFVHCKFEKELILKEFPKTEPSRIIIKPNHIMNFERYRPPLEKRKNIVAFMGPALNYKTIDPMVKLIRADKACKYQYHFYLMKPGDIPSGLREELQGRPNVAISYGYLDDQDYYRIYEKASWIVLTHDRRFEGRTSGVLSDAIASGVPILTYPIAPQTEYFSQFGPFGFLAHFNSDQWIQPFLELNLSENYPIFEKTMTKARASGNVINITNAFREALLLESSYLA
jgi:glycosyltransferase involved in cell wall biosynthesis